MHITDGVLVNASWTPYIATSSDGTNWELIPKEGLKIRPRLISANATSPTTKKEKSARITLSGPANETHTDFDIEDVDNQPTWNFPTTAALNIAVADIGSW